LNEFRVDEQCDLNSAKDLISRGFPVVLVNDLEKDNQNAFYEILLKNIKGNKEKK